MPFTPPPEWADDTNYDAGANAWNGNPTKRAPSVGLSAKGIEPGEFLTAQHFNYLMNALGLSIEELQAAVTSGPASSTDNALARFDGTTGKIVQNSVITVSDAGAMSGGTDITLSGEVLYTKARSKSLGSAVGWFPRGASDGWTYVGEATDAYSIATNVAIGGGLVFDLTPHLRTGAIITSISVRLKPGAARAPGSRMAIQAFYSDTLSAAGLTTLGSTVEDDGTTSEQTVVFTPTGGASATVTAGRDYRVLAFKGSNTGASVDLVRGIVIGFTDPGPRNA